MATPTEIPSSLSSSSSDGVLNLSNQNANDSGSLERNVSSLNIAFDSTSSVMTFPPLTTGILIDRYRRNLPHAKLTRNKRPHRLLDSSTHLPTTPVLPKSLYNQKLHHRNQQTSLLCLQLYREIKMEITVIMQISVMTDLCHKHLVNKSD